jgi:hypothetical protein
MKYLKTFENLNIVPEVGDYIIANSKYASSKLQKFFLTNIGEIINISMGEGNKLLYNTDYDPDMVESAGVILDDNSWFFITTEILHISKNKEDLESILQANKYNL